LTFRGLHLPSAQPVILAVGGVLLVGIGIAAITLALRTGATQIAL
jgi:hypothetical protein